MRTLTAAGVPAAVAAMSGHAWWLALAALALLAAILFAPTDAPLRRLRALIRELRPAPPCPRLPNRPRKAPSRRRRG
jgi:hypothetical protein